MSLFHKDKTEPTKEELELAKDRVGTNQPDHNAEAVSQTEAENRVLSKPSLGGDRPAGDKGGVETDTTHYPHGYDYPIAPGHQLVKPEIDQGTVSVDREIAVTTGDHGEVVDVQEVDTGSKKGKSKR